MNPLMGQQNWGYFDPDFETLSKRINPPRVVIDNNSCEDCTLITVDCVNTHGCLLEVVQVLAELELCISKAYIFSDGGWFMDVFHVTDQENKKVLDEKTIEYIKLSLGSGGEKCLGKRVGRSVGVQSVAKYTVIELTGTDRPGLLSEFSAVLMELGCNVNHAEVWTHNRRVACVVYVTDESSGGPVEDPEKQARMREVLCNIMKGKDDGRGARTEFSRGHTNTSRRLHQLMFADRDYEGDHELPGEKDGAACKPLITVQSCEEKGYSIVNVESADRPKLLFDTVCTITDMQYVVFHATINVENDTAHQEYYIRHLDGQCLDSEAEKTRVIKCLEAAIERRVSDGLRLKLCTSDRVGVLSEMTRTFRENGLSVTRADVETIDGKAVNVFYVTDASGEPVDPKVVDSLRRQMEIGQTILKVNDIRRLSRSPTNEPGMKDFDLGSFLKAHSERLLLSLLGCFGCSLMYRMFQ